MPLIQSSTNYHIFLFHTHIQSEKGRLSRLLFSLFWGTASRNKEQKKHSITASILHSIILCKTLLF